MGEVQSSMGRIPGTRRPCPWRTTRRVGRYSRQAPSRRGRGPVARVEATGLEPVTPCLQSRCAASCATPPGPGDDRAVDHVTGSVTSAHRACSARSDCTLRHATAPAAATSTRTTSFFTTASRRAPREGGGPGRSPPIGQPSAASAGGRHARTVGRCLSWAPSCTSRHLDGSSFPGPGSRITSPSNPGRCPGSSSSPRRPVSARRP